MKIFVAGLEEILHIIVVNMFDEDEIDVDDDGEEFDEEAVKDNPTTILSNSSAQVQKLLIFLKQHTARERDTPLKALIFVQRRLSAKVLANIIRRFANAYPEMGIKVDFMVGNNSRIPESIESYLTNKSNSKVLDKFRKGEINMIVATNVLEEGIDLQECNLVVAFDTPKHYRSYVQTKGRARMRNSDYVIMNPLAETEKLRNNIAQWKQINEILKKVNSI